MKKEAFLAYWRSLRKNQKLCPGAVPYHHQGSTYDEDGVRITGSRAFMASVLSRLKDLLKCENDETRLQVAYERSVDRETGKVLRSWNCYVQVHERGQEAKERRTGRKHVKKKSSRR